MPKHGEHLEGHPNLQFWGKQGFIRVRVKLPADVARTIGKAEFVKALGTPCIAEAVRRSHGPLADIQAIIDSARQSGADRARLMVEDMRGLATRIAANNDQQRHRILQSRLGDAVPADLPLAGITYQAGVALWVASKGDQPPGQETQAVYLAHLRRLFARLGHDEMNRVSADDIVEHAVILSTGADGGKRLSNKSVNNHLASIRAVFRAVKFGRKIATDPTVGTVRKMKVGQSARRKGFTPEQHAAIITAALKSDNEAIKWLWVIGALTGARIGELADATVDAICMIGKQPCININESHRRIWEGKPLSIKGHNEGSARIVPLHSAIVKAGFLAYVDRIRGERGDKAPLFQFNPNNHGRYSDAASEQCLSWLRSEVGITDPALVFHTLRHTFKTMMRTAKVGEEVHDAITGHAGGGVGRSYGSNEVAGMAKAIEKIRVA